MTPDEYLKQDVGSLVASLLFQNAMLKAEIDRLKAAQDNGHPAPDLVARSAP